MNKKGSSPLTGIICMWSGAIVDIPDGWLLCDGNNGTPNLLNLSIIGAGDTYDPGDTDPTPEHAHISSFISGNQSANHQHPYSGQVSAIGGGSSGYNDIGGGQVDYLSHRHTYSGNTGNQDAPHHHDVTGPTDGVTPLSPYYALAFIMKT